jgi:hypothetical protein
MGQKQKFKQSQCCTFLGLDFAHRRDICALIGVLRSNWQRGEDFACHVCANLFREAGPAIVTAKSSNYDNKRNCHNYSRHIRSAE